MRVDNKSNDNHTIQNQKDILTKLMEEQGFMIKKYFIDDGYSGINFNRPAYQEMMDYVRKSNINAVAVKDITRISRNILDYVDFANEMQDRNVEIYFLQDSFSADELKVMNSIKEYH